MEYILHWYINVSPKLVKHLTGKKFIVEILILLTLPVATRQQRLQDVPCSGESACFTFLSP
jgi:hypothetical protein